MPDEVAVSKPRTFAEIAEDVSAYQETLEMVEAQIQDENRRVMHEKPPSDGILIMLKREHYEIQQHLERIGKELSTKTDACAGVIRRLDADRDEITAEIKRLTAKRKAAEKASDWLKQYIMASMKQNSLTRLKTATNTITIAKNGGRQSLSIPHPELVPGELCWYRIAPLSFLNYKMLVDNLDGSPVQDVVLQFTERIPDNEAIRAKVEAGETVRGAKLEPRGERLDVR